MQLAQATTDNTLDFYNTAQGQLPGVDSSVTQAGDGFGSYLSAIFSGVMVIAALSVLIYLLWGAIEWITAGGDKGKIQKARDRITQSVVGIIVLSATVALFIVVQQFLGIRVLNFTGSRSGSNSNTNLNNLTNPSLNQTGPLNGGGGTTVIRRN